MTTSEDDIIEQLTDANTQAAAAAAAATTPA